MTGGTERRLRSRRSHSTLSLIESPELLPGFRSTEDK